MKRAARSYFLALRASSRFGRAVKLRDAGKNEAAAKAALEALAIMAHPHAVRSNPAEAASIVSATLLLEGLAVEVGTPSASRRDVLDTLTFIRIQGAQAVHADWLPYLEQRIAHWSDSAAA